MAGSILGVESYNTISWRLHQDYEKKYPHETLYDNEIASFVLKEQSKQIDALFQQTKENILPCDVYRQSIINLKESFPIFYFRSTWRYGKDKQKYESKLSTLKANFLPLCGLYIYAQYIEAYLYKSNTTLPPYVKSYYEIKNAYYDPEGYSAYWLDVKENTAALIPHDILKRQLKVVEKLFEYILEPKKRPISSGLLDVSVANIQASIVIYDRAVPDVENYSHQNFLISIGRDRITSRIASFNVEMVAGYKPNLSKLKLYFRSIQVMLNYLQRTEKIDEEFNLSDRTIQKDLTSLHASTESSYIRAFVRAQMESQLYPIQCKKEEEEEQRKADWQIILQSKENPVGSKLIKDKVQEG